MIRTIKILIALAGLALLPACWGLKAPPPVTVTAAGICTANPFHTVCDSTYEIIRAVKISECVAEGAAATPTCADAVNANSCLRDPFALACETNNSFAPYIDRARSARGAYCELSVADPTLCTGAAGSAYLDTECLDSPANAPAYASCSTRLGVVLACTNTPFTRTGCGNVPTIEALRIAHCKDSATAWDDGCVEATYADATAARNTACLTHGIDAEAGGHADCAARDNVLVACGDNTPFAYDVCDAVEGIDIKRINACLSNLGADDRCVALITPTCTTTPLAGVSCSDIVGYSGFLDTFCAKDNNAAEGGCAMTPAALCPADPFGVAVTVRDGTVDCSADEAYDSDRQALCASGMEGNNECDTAEIAPEVCASSGDNANPFADFCTDADNIGGDDEIDVIRQTALNTCFDGMSDDDNGVCQNTITARGDLATACVLAVAFEDRCDYTQYDTAREGFCTTQSTTWNALCDGETISGTGNARDQECIDDRQGNADDGHTGGDMPCPERQAVIAACPATDPFAARVCDRVVASTINPRRAIYCNMEINAWKDDCTGGSFGGIHDSTTAEGEACVRFGTDANTGGHSSCDMNSKAKMICGMAGTNPLDTTANMGCRMLENFAEISKAYCVADPFTTVGCDALNNFADIVGDYCVANPNEATCKTDHMAWNGTFTAGSALATAPDSNDTANRFLSDLTGATAVPTTDFTPLTITVRDGQTANATPYLNLADTQHGFGGRAEDGVMFFGGQLNDNSYRYYAGIYSSTNLGAPLTDVSKNGVWEAWMRTSGKDPENEAFTLTVDFNATTASGTLKAFFQSTSGTNTALYYNINGRFGINGVITGNVAIGTEDSGSILESGNEYTLGDLTGLIGARGVVAAFVSDTSTVETAGGINPFVGGFVGVPPTVTYGDWNAVAMPDAALEDSPIANQFLQYSAGGGGGVAVVVNLKDARHTDAPLGGDVADGFAYNTAGTSPDFVYYVGILPSTDLGLPLDATTAMGTWNGSFISIEDGTAATPADFILTVTFSATSNGNAGSVAPSEKIGDYNFTGEFDARGVIAGTVTHTVTNPTEVISMGTLQGLIGQDGAVGVFISNSDASMDYGGGFVARKQP